MRSWSWFPYKCEYLLFVWTNDIEQELQQTLLSYNGKLEFNSLSRLKCSFTSHPPTKSILVSIGHSLSKLTFSIICHPPTKSILVSIGHSLSIICHLPHKPFWSTGDKCHRIAD
ncbi:hypothetical protein C7M84_016278 [Penaeus vannamei]|uniref:Uncharacterized protein n=1 Tax=Penaeus vannamei TaxID=6689 RepID=A0A423SNM9_PENVA|nr:hypothetical protein C7M84_016278 [Penaeus vannamei]